MTCFTNLAKHCAVLAAFLLAAPAVGGCADEKEILDIDTPGGSIDVEQSEETGEIDVDVDDR